jgi:hypothetical protein
MNGNYLCIVGVTFTFPVVFSRCFLLCLFEIPRNPVRLTMNVSLDIFVYTRGESQWGHGQVYGFEN